MTCKTGADVMFQRTARSAELCHLYLKSSERGQLCNSIKKYDDTA